MWPLTVEIRIPTSFAYKYENDKIISKIDSSDDRPFNDKQNYEEIIQG